MEGEVRLVQSWKVGNSTYDNMELTELLIQDLISDMEKLLFETSPTRSEVVELFVFKLNSINESINTADMHIRRGEADINVVDEITLAIIDFDAISSEWFKASNYNVATQINRICQQILD